MGFLRLFEGSEFEAPLPETVERWGDILRDSGVQVNIRVSRGQDILAACGQLAAKGPGFVIG
ncbi:MAG: hypothetical protein WC956_01340 [bacterium]